MNLASCDTLSILKTTMPDLTNTILESLGRPSYNPVKPKVLFKRMNLAEETYPDFRKTVRALIHEGKIVQGRNNTLKLGEAVSALSGTYRRTAGGKGFVRLDTKPGDGFLPDVLIRDGRELDAANGDRVLVKLSRKSTNLENAKGEIIKIVERGTRTFVGTYFERDGEAFVRVDGTVFAHSIGVGDPGAKGVKSQDKVQIEIIRFPTSSERGEGVITEVFGPLTQPGVDLLTVIRAFGIPDTFSEEVLAEARAVADGFREVLDGRTDFTNELVVTIDPIDAKDFDDAISLTIDPKTNHWILTVHIADVAHFIKPGGKIDEEARKRGTSVYLPQKVIPMVPELISNGLASLQAGKLRYVRSVRMEITPEGGFAHTEFFNGAIRATKRFHYEQVQAHLDGTSPEPDAEIGALLDRMKTLALILRKKRFQRGSLELSMPEAILQYDENGKVVGATFAKNDLSHQLIEEFMLAANVAVAQHFGKLQVPFLRRVHPAPKPEKLYDFSQFAALLGYPIKKYQDRFELQRLLNETADKPERAAIHFALLRSLKQATYSPIQEEHYALACADYCHFTSPIRRYPDLQVHRLLDRWIKTGKASADEAELIALGEHCSKTERRAEQAERELVKLRILQYLSNRIGEQFDAVITGVAEYGFFAQAEKFPAEGLIHVSSLTDDYYHFDDTSRSLTGSRTQRRFRLGDRVSVRVARVDLQKRMLDLRLAVDDTRPPIPPELYPKTTIKPKKRTTGKPVGLPKPKKKRK